MKHYFCKYHIIARRVLHTRDIARAQIILRAIKCIYRILRIHSYNTRFLLFKLKITFCRYVIIKTINKQYSILNIIHVYKIVCNIGENRVLSLQRCNDISYLLQTFNLIISKIYCTTDSVYQSLGCHKIRKPSYVYGVV